MFASRSPSSSCAFCTEEYSSATEAAWEDSTSIAVGSSACAGNIAAALSAPAGSEGMGEAEEDEEDEDNEEEDNERGAGEARRAGVTASR